MESFIAIGLNDPKSWGLIVLSYLIGSISSAVITCKLMGLEDPRLSGSKNPGATNVLRNSGKAAAAITLIGDMLKGVIPVLFAHYLAVDYNVLALVIFAAFIGHLYPVFLKFKGGKGVATALGVFLAMNWMVGVGMLVIWLAMALTFKISSLSALTAALFAPALTWYFTGVDVLVGVSVVIMVLIYYRHTSNIRDLLSGAEEKIGKKNS